jgi:hypothetical protein
MQQGLPGYARVWKKVHGTPTIEMSDDYQYGRRLVCCTIQNAL